MTAWQKRPQDTWTRAGSRYSLTLGRPGRLLTYMYLHRRLTAMGYEAEIVSGVTSFCAAAARLSVSLGDGSTPIHILPGSFPPLEEGLSSPGTRVLMNPENRWEP